MLSSDLKVLGQIRERRLDRAMLEKSCKERELESASQALEKAKKDAEEERQRTERKINEIYEELIGSDGCGVADVESARIEEALMRENVARLDKEAKEAEVARDEAEEKVSLARKKAVEMSAAKEAIDLLSEEEAKKQRFEEARAEDDLIDEIAIMGGGSARRQ